RVHATRPALGGLVPGHRAAVGAGVAHGALAALPGAADHRRQASVNDAAGQTREAGRPRSQNRRRYPRNAPAKMTNALAFLIRSHGHYRPGHATEITCDRAITNNLRATSSPDGIRRMRAYSAISRLALQRYRDHA